MHHDGCVGRLRPEELHISNAIARGETRPRFLLFRLFSMGSLGKRLKARLLRKSLRRRAVRAGLVAFNAGLLVVIVSVVIFNPVHTNSVSQPLAAQGNAEAAAAPVDHIASVDIAAAVANMTHMMEAPEVNGQALADKVQSQSGVISQGMAVAKAQVVGSAFVSNKDIKTYVVQPGDTLSSLASKFSISTSSIRWSNSLSYYANPRIGQTLLIPPIDGIVYTVKAGDTAQSLAQAYAASQDLIVADNDAELGGLTPGERIIIPGGTMPGPAYTPSYGYGAGAVGSYNMYAQWNCTWWVAYRWAQTGRPNMPLLGNASQWWWNAKADGLSVSAGPGAANVPRPYAAAVTSTYGYGHVVFVEGVNADGSINISEMNVNGENTWYPVRYDPTYSTVSASVAAHYLYIY